MNFRSAIIYIFNTTWRKALSQYFTSFLCLNYLPEYQIQNAIFFISQHIKKFTILNVCIFLTTHQIFRFVSYTDNYTKYSTGKGVLTIYVPDMMLLRSDWLARPTIIPPTPPTAKRGLKSNPSKERHHIMAIALVAYMIKYLKSIIFYIYHITSLVTKSLLHNKDINMLWSRW